MEGCQPTSQSWESWQSSQGKAAHLVLRKGCDHQPGGETARRHCSLRRLHWSHETTYMRRSPRCPFSTHETSYKVIWREVYFQFMLKKFSPCSTEACLSKSHNFKGLLHSKMLQKTVECNLKNTFPGHVATE